MKLMIVESPNKTKKIKAILGDGWEVAASVGHFRDLPKKDLGVSADFALTYEYTERGKATIDSLKSRVARAEMVYIATDPDREGEAIAWHLVETLKLKKYQRVTFDAITEAVILKAIASPRQLDMNLVSAQAARRAEDRLLGWKVSPLLSRQTGVAGLSAGRVQSVAVRLVVDRQAEIDGFRPTKHFGVEATFEDGKWTAKWDTSSHFAEGQQYITDRELPMRVALCKDFTVTASETKPASQAPKPAFTTSTMLQAGSVSLCFTPEETAALAQKLFEQGLITYHRTDSQNFSAEAIAEVRAFANTKNLPLPKEPRRWKSKDNAQEAHEAIRPTHLEHQQAGEDERQRQLYEMIWKRAVASQLADAEYSVTRLQLTANSGQDNFTFSAMGRVLTLQGWRLLTPKDAAEDTLEVEETGDSTTGAVPPLSVAATVTASSTRVTDKVTKAPSAYTEATLIKKLETEGIGRPSTYPETLKKIIATRKYVDEQKRKLAPTELGKLLAGSLTGHFSFVDYTYTRDLEQHLDDIASGKASYGQVLSNLDSKLNIEIQSLHVSASQSLAGTPVLLSRRPEEPGLPCPKCKEGAVRKPKGQTFFGCSRYKDGCTYNISAQIAGKNITDTHAAALISKGRVGPLKGFTSKAGKPFEATLVCTAESNWKTVFDFRNKD
ncbi:MAG: type I DNA topoisomerase [Acidobacteriota bacterium]|nr:type I DNA topoisomerase [Acidobacteriota bacterium]